MSAPPIVQIEGLGRAFGEHTPIHALREVSLTVGHGDRVAIVGPSGSGKSTLLNLLGLLDTPTSGSYVLDGTAIEGLSERELAGIRADKIGFVFQEFHLIPRRTTRENVELGLLYRRVPKAERNARAERALLSVGLDARLDANVETLSGGERQRVAIARAIVNEPKLLLADEPTGNLDEENSDAILEVLSSARRPDAAQIIVTHDASVADRCDRQIVVRYGRVEGS